MHFIAPHLCVCLIVVLLRSCVLGRGAQYRCSLFVCSRLTNLAGDETAQAVALESNPVHTSKGLARATNSETAVHSVSGCCVLEDERDPEPQLAALQEPEIKHGQTELRPSPPIAPHPKYNVPPHRQGSRRPVPPLNR